ncbi:MAG TPA: HAD-IA family hydrolase [Acidimicrobiales bacterium]|nr:HAD-IA family hydrolase [Acidimicrobiales bacterium]
MHPFELRGWLFDLDGVLTDTARVHVEAWKTTFDELLGRLAISEEQARPFDPVEDYLLYVDGKPRADGVRDFLASRGVVLAEGARDDPPDRQTVQGVGNAKNALFLRLLSEEGVEAFPGSVRFVRALVAAGRCTGVVSASENCRAILEAARLSGQFWVVVDGLVALEHHLQGKPAPDTYQYGAELLHLPPSELAVVEDAPAGVAAGRAGGFGYVVGVARRATPGELLAAGADVVVADLEEFDELMQLLLSWLAGRRGPRAVRVTRRAWGVRAVTARAYGRGSG